jgi:hypothetical protein
LASIYEALRWHGSSLEVPHPYGRPFDELLSKATVVHVDSALDYWFFGTPPEEYFDIADFPNLAPRFGTLFIERREKWWAFNETVERPVRSEDRLWRHGLWHTGLLFEALDLGEDLRSGGSAYEELREALAVHIADRAYDEEVRWCLNIYLAGANPINPVAEGPLINWLSPVTADGSAEPHMTGRPSTLISYPLVGDVGASAAQRAWVDAALSYLLPALFGVTALNSPEARLIPAGRGCGGPRGRTYDLDIDGLKTTLNDVGKAELFGLQRALHVCRDLFSRSG